MTRTVITMEAGTAAASLAVTALPLAPVLVLLPVLGLMLNGTSSVLYVTVPELAPGVGVERAFVLYLHARGSARSRLRCSEAGRLMRRFSAPFDAV